MQREREFKREIFSLFFLFRLLFLLIKTIETNRTVDPELFLYFWLLKKLMVSTGVAVSYSIQGYNHWDFLSDFLQVDSRANNNSLIEIPTKARV